MDEQNNPTNLKSNQLQAQFETHAEDLAELYNALMPDILQEAKRYLNQQARSALPGASAVVHSALMSTFEKPEFWESDLQDEESMRRMLFDATLRHCRKHNRRVERHRDVSIDRAAGGDEEQRIDLPETRKEMGRVYAESIQELLNRLTDRQQQILLLEWNAAAMGERVSQQQIANRLGVSKRSVQLDWAEIKKQGKQLVAESEDE